MIDVLRPRWPTGFGCVIDAAFTSEHVAVGISRSGTTVVIETKLPVSCAALSQIEPGLWVGDDRWTAAVATEHTVIGDARFARARPYLTTAPIALSVELPVGRVLATMQPEPLDAWVSIDSTDAMADAAAKRLIAVVAQLANDPVTEPFAKQIKVTREGPQVVVRLQGSVTGDLAAATRALIARLPGNVARRHHVRCPTPVIPPVTECLANGSLDVLNFVVAPDSIGEVVSPILGADLTPVVTNSVITGLRLPVAVPALGLEPGDVIIGAAGRTITHRVQLSEILRSARLFTSISVERDGAITMLSLVAR